MNNNQFRFKMRFNHKFAALHLALSLTATGAVPALCQDSGECNQIIKQATALFAKGKILDASLLLEKSRSKCKDSARYHLLLSTILSRAHGQKEKAIEAARYASRLDPNSKAAHLQLAMCLMAAGKKEEAKDAFIALVKIDPTSYEGWTSLNQLFTLLGNNEEAAVCARKAACLEPESREARLKVVSNLVSLGKLSDARAELSKLNSDDTLEPEFFIIVAGKAEKLGAYVEAVEACDKVLAVYPGSYETLKIKAISLLWLRKYRDCLKVCTTLKQAGQFALRASAIEAFCQVKLGDMKSARGLAGDALAKNNNDPVALLAQGMINFQDGKVKEAVKFFEESLAANQLFAPAHIELSRLYMKLGDVQKSAEEAFEIARSEEHKASALAMEGRIALSKGPDTKFMKEAREKLKASLKLDEKNPDALIGLADVHLKAGNIDEAARLSKTVFDNEPGNIDALILMSRVKALNGNQKASSSFMKKARELAPGEGDLIVFLADSYINQGNSGKAIKLLKKNIEASSDFPTLDFTLAKILNESGNRADAAKYFKDSLNKGLAGKNAREARRAIKEINATLSNEIN